MRIAIDLTGLNRFENGDSPRAKRHAMLIAGFHSVGRYGPKSLHQIDFIPTQTGHFAGPRGCQNKKFKSSRTNTLLLMKRGHEVR